MPDDKRLAQEMAAALRATGVMVRLTFRGRQINQLTPSWPSMTLIDQSAQTGLRTRR